MNRRVHQFWPYQTFDVDDDDYVPPQPEGRHTIHFRACVKEERDPFPLINILRDYDYYPTWYDECVYYYNDHINLGKLGKLYYDIFISNRVNRRDYYTIYMIIDGEIFGRYEDEQLLSREPSPSTTFAEKFLSLDNLKREVERYYSPFSS
jgi:hypothetical protein